MMATVSVDVVDARNNSPPIAQTVRFGSLADLTPSLGHGRFTPPKGDIERGDGHVCFVPKADMKSFDDLVGDLVAPYRIDTGIPSNRNAKGEHEGRC